MSAFSAAFSGIGRALAAPLMLLGIFFATVVAAVPATWVMKSSLEQSIGQSLVHEKLRDGFDMGWFGEFEARAKGLETTFTPTQVGAGAFLNNMEAWISGDLFSGFPGLLGLGLVYGLLWAFLLGGVLNRYSDPMDGPGFMASAAAHFFRFVRLAVISALAYFLVYRLHGWTFGKLEAWTLEETRERTVLIYSLIGYGITGFLLVLVHVSFAYAKIATVVEQRSSMALAALRGLGFVLAHPIKTLGLYAGMALIGLGFLWLYARIGPGIAQATSMQVFFAFSVSQLFLLLRLGLKMSLLAGEVALFRGLEES